MTFNGRPVYYSVKMQYVIDGDDIVGNPVKNHKSIINIIIDKPLDGSLDQSGLFLKLLAVDETDNDSILCFYNSAGSLLRPFSYASETVRETLENVRYVIRTFKHVFMLYQSIQENNWNDAQEHSKYFENHFSDYIEFPSIESVKGRPLYSIKVFINIINFLIKECGPIFEATRHENDALSYEVLWSGATLLNTLYLDFAMSISTNKRYRKCKSRNCREYFEVTDPRKEFCSMTCKNYENINRWRDNKKQKENTPAKPKEKDNKNNGKYKEN